MKQVTKEVRNWKFGVLTSLCACLFVLFACSEEKASVLEASLQNDQAEVQREIFTKVEEQPSYKGGMDAFYQYVMSETKYPLEARENGVEGTVQVQFVIERNGSISNVRTTSGIGSGCDEEAVRVIKNSTGFIAGSQRGRTTRVTMVMPVTFKLESDKRNADDSVQGSIVAGKVLTQASKLLVKVNYKNGEYSGTVTNADGGALAGANIVVEGTQYGTVADRDGTFSIRAELGQLVSITFVGYEKAILKN